MARYFVPITEADFRIKLDTYASKLLHREYGEDELTELSVENKIASALMCGVDTKLTSDLSKVIFDYENVYSDKDDFSPLQGIDTLPNGMPFCGINAGGDWEHPIFFIVYWDGKQIRGYIPEDGNTYNKKYKTAYGSEEESKKFKDATYVEPDWENMPDLNVDLVIEDISSRIKEKE